MSDFPLSRLRDETPGLEHVIHFNNAGASLMPSPVLRSVQEYLEQEAHFGGYETARRYSDELNRVYHSASKLIGADPEEIAIMENATAAWNMAFYSIDFSKGDRILTSAAEYASNYINYLRLRERVDVQIEVIPNDKHGQTSASALKEMMDGNVRLISITHIPTNSGLLNPAEEIGAVERPESCLFLLDACQSVGHYPVDVGEIGCDMLSATGRKYLRGPRGTGFLYVNRKRLYELTPPFLDLHSAEWVARDRYRMRDDARRFENWESNYAGIMGLNTAIEYALSLGMDAVWQRIVHLAATLRERLDKVSTVNVRDIGEVLGGIVTFTVDGTSAEMVRKKLEETGINVSVTTKSSTLIDMEERNLESLVRASVHYYNTEEEIKKLVFILK